MGDLLRLPERGYVDRTRILIELMERLAAIFGCEPDALHQHIVNGEIFVGWCGCQLTELLYKMEEVHDADVHDAD